MRRVDKALRDIAQSPRPARIALEASTVAERIGTIDSDDAAGDTFDEKALPAIGKLERVRTPLGAEVCRKVFGGHQAGDRAPAGFGDGDRLYQTAGEFDVRHQRGRALGYVIFPFEPRHRLVQPRHVKG